MNFIKDSSGLKDRNIGIELLRIISMFFIVMQHFACHGIANRESLSFSFNKIFLYNCRANGKRRSVLSIYEMKSPFPTAKRRRFEFF